MSSSDSAVTYTSISSEDVSFLGFRFFGMKQPDLPEAAPQSPIQTSPVSQDEDEREPMFIQPYDPDHMPEPMYPEYIPLEDEHVLPAEEQPLPPVVSPTAESPGYVAELDPKKDPEEYEDDESEDGPVDYPMDEGDDGDDDEDEDEEEELSFEVKRLLAMPTPPPSPLTLLLPPSAEERLARIASTHTLIDAVTAALPSPPLPPLPPPLYIPPVDHRDDIPETEQPPYKKSCLFALGPMYEVDESFTARPTRGRGIDYGFVSTLDAEARRQGIREVGYGIRDTWVDSAEVDPEIEPMTLGKVNTRVIELVELHEHDIHDLYALLEDAQESRTRISQRVTMDSQRVDLLMEDMIAPQETILIVEEEAYTSREAWAHSIGLSQTVYYELQTHRE
nr:hypothetical protein [Tanacetum cinerariifolium]GEY06735.1 hypothetical protein [Tanacetum cinerariifolium]